MDEQYFDYRFYSYIYKDEELKALFDKLTENYLERIKNINEWAEIEIKANYPDFAPIKEQIRNLEKVGIVVEDYDKWLDPNEYNCTFDDFNVNIFCFAKFNGFILNEDEIKELYNYQSILNVDIDPDLIPGAQSVLDKDYFKKSLKKSLRTDKKLRREIKKAKKAKKVYNVNEPTVTQYYTDVDKIERTTKRLENNKLEGEKYRFLMEITTVQRKELLKTCYRDISNYQNECLSFIQKKAQILQEKATECEELTKVANSLTLKCELTENNIKLRVLKKLIEFSLIDIEQISEEDISIETKLMIDCFIKTNSEELRDMYSEFETNFDCFYEEREKNKKLDYRRTI